MDRIPFKYRDAGEVFPCWTAAERRIVRIQFLSGFSLIEVTLAIAIVAFAFVTMSSLVPVGMKSLRKAMDTTIIANISQYMINDAGQTSFSTLVAQANAQAKNGPVTLYFDNQGRETTQGNWVYQAAGIVVYPASFEGVGGTTSTNCLEYVVQVAVNPAHQNLPTQANGQFQDNGQVPITTRAVTIAKMQ